MAGTWPPRWASSSSPSPSTTSSTRRSDKIIWDVGHQCYAHKILTGRREDFRDIRRLGGIAGFPKRRESAFDAFDTGHSSTSLSLACGAAMGRDLTRKKNKVIAIIGDGSLTGGMAFEAINQMGHTESDLIIILNDNEHSINQNVGAMSRYLTRIISSSTYNQVRRKSMEMVKKIPRVGGALFNFISRFFESFKKMLIPGQLFEDMGIRYFGPIDGHDITSLIGTLERVRRIDYGPKIIHVITKKGKGYLPAEMNPARFHGIGPFDRATGLTRGSGSALLFRDRRQDPRAPGEERQEDRRDHRGHEARDGPLRVREQDAGALFRRGHRRAARDHLRRRAHRERHQALRVDLLDVFAAGR